MPSPLPGMDPWVEQHWESFHGWFIRKLAEQMLPKARALGCWIDVERSVYQKDHSGGVFLLGAPDDTVWLKYDGPNEWDSGGGTALQVAVAEPKAIHEIVLNDVDSERMKQDYLVVREMGRRRPVLAMIELLSPANKSGSYAPKYQEKRLKMLSVSAHFMEIDFLRSGGVFDGGLIGHVTVPFCEDVEQSELAEKRSGVSTKKARASPACTSRWVKKRRPSLTSCVSSKSTARWPSRLWLRRARPNLLPCSLWHRTPAARWASISVIAAKMR